MTDFGDPLDASAGVPYDVFASGWSRWQPRCKHGVAAKWTTQFRPAHAGIVVSIGSLSMIALELVGHAMMCVPLRRSALIVRLHLLHEVIGGGQVDRARAHVQDVDLHALAFDMAHLDPPPLIPDAIGFVYSVAVVLSGQRLHNASLQTMLPCRG